MSPIEIETKMRELIESLKAAKPNDRTDLDRRFAIMITEQEKILAYFIVAVQLGAFSEAQ